ncbi:hypothetical protein RchiOBHm_Chr6g0273641 [Rosa chinensis]|uniref:Uncharacterized protein n=1 Tax=Rosa chinensis TaxID=74649 RepID=A0A2P6PRJ0_ROSCH|nr:hypothetical protein RchiOBHm_Chr6g0273641 [Rosa chinensis]
MHHNSSRPSNWLNPLNFGSLKVSTYAAWDSISLCGGIAACFVIQIDISSLVLLNHCGQFRLLLDWSVALVVQAIVALSRSFVSVN